jgi:hypothetical protein
MSDNEETKGIPLTMQPKDKCQDCNGRGILVIRHPAVITTRKLVPCHCVSTAISVKNAEKYLFSLRNPITVFVRPVPVKEVKDADIPQES